MALPAPALLESMRPLHRREYHCLVELGSFDDERVELLAGVLVAMSPQGAEHADLVRRLAALLVQALGERAVVSTHSPLALGEDSEPEPDVAIVPPGDYAREHPTRAMLVVEVSDSSLRKDRELKAPVYAAAGVPEYWVVNLVDRVVEVNRAPQGARYANLSRHGRESTLHLLAFPDVAIAVGNLIR